MRLGAEQHKKQGLAANKANFSLNAEPLMLFGIKFKRDCQCLSYFSKSI